MLQKRKGNREPGEAQVTIRKGQWFAERLLGWNKGRERQFLWRQTRDPFAVLVAELMLQRTQAVQADRIFREFLGRYPNASSVVMEEPRVIEEQLGRLGLHHRARRLVELCKVLVERFGGNVPDSARELDSLPGVGPYTVGAVLCFGYGHDVAIVDRNVVRVLTRFFAFKPKAARPHTDKELWQLAQLLVPKGKGREYNMALLDFAAAICSDRPKHEICPVRDECCYYYNLEYTIAE